MKGPDLFLKSLLGDFELICLTLSQNITIPRLSQVVPVTMSSRTSLLEIWLVSFCGKEVKMPQYLKPDPQRL